MQVSLITCTYNSQKTIKDCCLSILSQTYENIEHIIIDRQSKDETLDIAKKYKIKNQKIIQQKGIGIYSAINEGIKAASGDIIGLLHSDDEFYNEDIIKNIVKKFHEFKINVLFSDLVYIDNLKKNKIFRKWKSNLNSGVQSNDKILKKINNGWMPPHTTLFIKKNFVDEIGSYNEKFKISSDYDFIIRLMNNRKLNLFYFDKFTVKMKTGGTSNKNIINVILKMKEDIDIMKNYGLSPLKTIIIKNLSKISQFF